MQKRTSVIPAVVGTALVGLVVLVLGNTWVQDDVIRKIDQQWPRSLTGPLRWDLAPDGRDFDVFVGFNLFPVVWVLATAVLLFVATRRRDRWSFATLFFSSWGALLGAAVAAAFVYWAYAEVILDSRFSRPIPYAGIVDGLHFTVSLVVDGPATIGMAVAVVIALAGTIMGTGGPVSVGPNPYAGSAVDPSPPMEPTGVIPARPVDPAAAPPPPTQAEESATGVASSTPPPPPPPS